MPGNPDLAGVAVTTITPESTASFPYQPTGTPNTFAEGFVPNVTPSGSPTSEGSQFLSNHITISPIDGNWGATGDARDALAVRLGSAMTPTAAAPHPLDILLIDEDGHDSAGIAATRDSLLSAGYDVTVLAPATDQSGVGSALFLNPITVTEFSANDFSASGGTPASLAALALDPQGLFNGVKPDLIVFGADQGDAVGIENANHSATLGGAITALYNYDVPSIALTSASGSAAAFQTSASFLTTLIENLQLTEGTSDSLLPDGIGLSINVPVGATLGNYAFTNIDAGTDANLSVLGNDNFAHYSYGSPVPGTGPHSEGDAFNAGKITVSPIDGNFAVNGSAAYDSLASLIGTTFGVATSAPDITGDLAVAVRQGCSVVLTTADLGATDLDTPDARLVFQVTAENHGQILVNGKAASQFTEQQLAGGHVRFRQDGADNATASFSVSLGDGSGLSTSATINAAVTILDHAPVFTSSPDFSVAENRKVVGTVTATDPDGDRFAFSIDGGSDKDFFTINQKTGALRFKHAPDFEAPKDADGDNVYEVDVAATDKGGAVSHQALSISVTDVAEGKKGKGGSGDDIVHSLTGKDLVAGFSSDNVTSSVHDALGHLRQAMAGFSSSSAFANFDDVMAAAHQGGNDMVFAADASHPHQKSFG